MRQLGLRSRNIGRRTSVVALMAVALYGVVGCAAQPEGGPVSEGGLSNAVLSTEAAAPERADASATWEETSGISSQEFVRTMNFFIDARVASHPEVREWGQLSADGLTVGLGVEDDADVRRTEKLRSDLATELAGTSLKVAITKPGEGVGIPVFVVPSDNHPAIGTWASDEFPYFSLELEEAGQGGGEEDCNSIGFHWSAPSEDSIEVQAIVSTAVGCEKRDSPVAPEFGTGTVSGDTLTLRNAAGTVTAELTRGQL